MKVRTACPAFFCSCDGDFKIAQDRVDIAGRGTTPGEEQETRQTSDATLQVHVDSDTL